MSSRGYDAESRRCSKETSADALWDRKFLYTDKRSEGRKLCNKVIHCKYNTDDCPHADNYKNFKKTNNSN